MYDYAVCVFVVISFCTFLSDWFEFCMFFFFKQKTAYEMRISDWSSDVCSSDLRRRQHAGVRHSGRQRIRGSLLRRDRRGGAAAMSVSGLAIRSPWTEISEGAVSALHANPGVYARSEEHRVGKECVSTCRSRWSPYH